IKIDPESAPQSRAAVSTTVSSTGCTSAVERLITLSTSLVAVWYSNDSSRSDVRSRNSLRSRAFSIAITACAAKFCNSAICLSVNGRTSCRKFVKQADEVAILDEGYHQQRADAARLDRSAWYRIICHRRQYRGQIGDVHPRLASPQPPNRAAGARDKALTQDAGEWLGHSAMHSPSIKPLAFSQHESAERGPAERARLLQHRVQYRREVAWRRVDHPQHVGGRGLLLQRLARLGQEPRVLHRDDRLRRKVLQ